MRLFTALLAVVAACSGDKDGSNPTLPPDDTGETAPTGDTGPTTTTSPQSGLCTPWPAASGAVTTAEPGDDLAALVASAAAGSTLSLAAGTYGLTAPLVLDRAITIRSADDDPASVVIDGDYLDGDLIQIRASGVVLAHVTLQRSGDALVRVAPADVDITGARLHGLRLVDPAGVAVAVGPDASEQHFADDGELSCSHLELTDGGRSEVLGLCDTGGFDAAFARGWVVRDNVIDGFWCDRGLPAPGVRFTRGSRDVKVLRNQLLDSPTGIIVGEGLDQLGRRYPDEPCGDAYAQAIDAHVINNVVSAWRDRLVYDSQDGLVSGIRAESSCNARILHNTVVHRVPVQRASIEHSYPLTSGIIANNLVSGTVIRAGDSAADVDTNMELASELNWMFPIQGDFRLAPAATAPIDAGSSAYLTEVPADLDDDVRSDPPDLGADERESAR